MDATPDTESEFIWDPLTSQFIANPLGPAAGKMDLLTIVMHQLGHTLGYPALDPDEHPYDLMSPILDVGLRRLPENSEPVLASTQTASASEFTFASSDSQTTSDSSLLGGFAVGSKHAAAVPPGAEQRLLALAEDTPQNFIDSKTQRRSAVAALDSGAPLLSRGLFVQTACSRIGPPVRRRDLARAPPRRLIAVQRTTERSIRPTSRTGKSPCHSPSPW